MRRLSVFLSLCSLIFAAPAGAALEEAEATIVLAVDARELPRNLLRSTMTITGKKGIAALAFPLWIPGNHAPSGPVQNIAEIRVTDNDGKAISWQRDIEHPERIDLEGVHERVNVEMTYIASQPSVISGSSDSYGRPNFGAINFNTCVLYPIGPGGDEYTHQNTIVMASLHKFVGHGTRTTDASSLRRNSEAWIKEYGHLSRPLPHNTPWSFFALATLAEMIDSPIITGEHLTSIKLTPVNGAPHTFHVVASEERFTKPHDWFIDKLNAMHEQAVKIFGPFPRERYDYLIVLDDHVRFGLEHGQSTFIGTKQKRLIDAKETELKGGGGELTVIPHEYVHVWVGKLRAPEGMRTSTFHEDRDTELLWVYEGLTTYYTDVLAARAGLITRAEYEHGLVNDIIAYEQRAGRAWRPLADTARSAGMLRDRGKFWIDYRRGQDYYSEGALFWMEADAIIRGKTSGGKSLDQFCLAFFDVPVRPIGDEATFTRADIVRALKDIDPSTDWDAMIRERIEEPRDDLSFNTLLRAMGVDLVYTDEPTDLQKEDAKGDTLRLRTSLGMDVNKQGHITHLTPGSPADGHKLAYGMRILAVDRFVFDTDRLKEAVKNSAENGSIELVVAHGDRIETRVITYNGGPRYPRLLQRDDTATHLQAIISAR